MSGLSRVRAVALDGGRRTVQGLEERAAGTVVRARVVDLELAGVSADEREWRSKPWAA